MKADGSVKAKEIFDGTLTAVNPLKSKTLPARITFISHAATAALQRASFPLDETLLDGEVEKIAALGWIAPRAQRVWYGPEKRTAQTARVLGLEASASAELRDIDYGSWRGQQIDEVQTLDPDGLADWLTNPHAAPHGGESVVQLNARINGWMASQTSAGHNLAVTHPAVIRAAIVGALQAPAESFWRVEIAPLSITDLRFNGRSWTVRSIGCSLRDSSPIKFAP